MNDVLRILDRFYITGRGTVYTVKKFLHSNIRIGDLFYDLRGNRFKIKCIEMVSRIPSGKNLDELPLVLGFELIDGIEAEGNILVRDMKEVCFLFCSHPLYPDRVDEDYEEEYQSAGAEHECALLNYDDLEAGRLCLHGEDISGLTIYRGWMMPPALYKTLYGLLEEKGIILINSPDEYERYHLLPGWYEDFKDDTPYSIWEDKGNVDSALQLTKGLEGSYIIKDYVKSRKHEWYDACYISNITDKANTKKIVRNFVERQGEDLIGGVVFRKYEKLKQIGYHEKSGMPLSEEYRVFVYAGKIMIVDDYWRKDEKIHFSDDEKQWIDSIAEKIRSNFVTIDIARCEDGRLLIMELGDGQVSGLQQIDPTAFYRAFSPELIHYEDIDVDDFFPEGAVIMAGDPMPDISAEEMKDRISKISSVQELVDAYVNVHNKFWYIEDDLYDYEEGTEEYERFRSIVETWGEMMDELDSRIMKKAEEQGLLAPRQKNSGTVKQLEAFMDKYGYRDGCGWWVKK